PVTTPAYPDTEVKVGARSLEQIKALDQPPEWKLKRRKMLHQLNKEDLLKGIE
ncbi:MAG: HK97 family phage prohead protease, partial [Lacticaseibacillus paracasei]|nr:HK97 family phage prohead protease [Lacticaseibacillus paracasei]